jgi:nicotinamide-nucleotide amidase
LLDEAETELRRRLGDVIFGRDDETLAAVVGHLLAPTGRTLSTAESCTGGMIGTLVTDIAGSSRYYKGGVVSYANSAKVDLLGVSPDEIERSGAVSEAVARAMAEGAARRFNTEYALSVTGIAGPVGGTPMKPVGLVFIGLRTPRTCTAHEYRFGDDSPRQVIRIRAARTALNVLRIELLHLGS